MKAHARAIAPHAPLATEGEREEFRRPRDENRILRMERDFLKIAAALFAKESK